jgi:hypothetical protein
VPSGTYKLMRSEPARRVPRTRLAMVFGAFGEDNEFLPEWGSRPGPQ